MKRSDGKKLGSHSLWLSSDLDDENQFKDL